MQQTLSCEKSSSKLAIKADLVVSTVRQWYLILLKVIHTAVELGILCALWDVERWSLGETSGQAARVTSNSFVPVNRLFFLKSLQVNCSYSGSNLKEQNIIVVSWSLELSQCSNCLRPSNRQRKMETWKRPRKERGLTHTFSLYLYATITPRLLTDCLEQVSVAWARTQVTAQSFAFPPPPPPRSATTGVSDRGSLGTNVVIWGRLENWTSRHHVITEE